MPAVDFDKEFSSFVNSGTGSAIKDVYSIIPSLSDKSMKCVGALTYYAEKYDLQDIKMFVNQYVKNMSSNKNLSFMRSLNLKNLLKAYTQDELIRGVKATTQRSGDE